MELRNSWLVQRLTKPRSTGGLLGGKDNPFAFGGGYKNGGLSDDAMDLLRPHFGFDYMGAAEFEFGEVPRAFQKVAKSASAETLAAQTVTVKLNDVPRAWNDKRTDKREGERKIFVIADSSVIDEVCKRVHGWAKESFQELKEQTFLRDALDPVGEWHRDVAGWLELDNGFMFFTDETMFAGVAEIFGLEVNEMVS